MPVTERQLAAFADRHGHQIPYDTSPRHLAGPGDARHVTHGLAAAGWTTSSDPLSPQIVLTSPDRRYTVDFNPQSRTDTWWTLRAEYTDTAPGWYAAFSELVPAEVLGRLTDALSVPPSAPGPRPFQILESAGWKVGPTTTAQSPDGMCHVERHNETHEGGAQTSYWRVDTCEPGHGTPRGRQIWGAWLPSPVPEALITAFLQALTETAPLQRAMYDRTAHYRAVQKPSALSPEQVVQAHADRLKTIRAQVRAARRRPTTTPPTAPAPSGTHRATARR
ncbi:DUF317 domain-containing protein [Streptomyces anulatus]|uniref:DUF317 domain-containing protein n=1 Tax=Streptomyces anulatus TaxID=1892 RepID=UPI00386B9381|nr:DUF317 domain-containing protein [Streptomyces anulatus]